MLTQPLNLPGNKSMLKLAMLTISAVIAFGVAFTYWTASHEDRRMREELLGLAHTAAASLNLDMVKRLSGAPEDLETPEYQRLKHQLMRMRSVNPRCRFIYLMGRRDGAIFIHVDSERPDSNDYSPPGQIYSEAPDAAHRIFNTGENAVHGPYTDRWGDWISAFTPLVDPDTGKLLVVFGMDIGSRDWMTLITLHGATPILITLLLATLISVYFVLYQRAERDRQRIATSEASLRESEERIRTIVDTAVEGIITIDEHGVVESINPAALKIFGYGPQEVVGHNVRMLMPMPFASAHDGYLAHYADAGEKHIIGIGREVQGLNREGVVFPMEISVTEVHLGGRRKFVGFVHDISERKQAGEVLRRAHDGLELRVRERTKALQEVNQQLEHQATHDALTGLVNRTEFERRLGLMLEHARPDGREHALCYLDLDEFKIVNDTCGHRAGDELLRQITALLRTRLRERDALARLGGDEFGVLLGECPLDEALRIANALREMVHDFRFTWGKTNFRVGVSIGLVPVTPGEWNLSQALAAADTACYSAKDKGRNRVHVYALEDNDLVQRQGDMRWVNRIHHALSEDRLQLYFQPIVSIHHPDDCVLRGEILLRMIDEQGEIVPPGAFISAAERYHQMLAVDRWVIKHLFDRLRARKALWRTNRCILTINISGQSLGDEDFQEFLLDAIQRTAMPAGSLCFEITETAAICDLSSALRFIQALKTLQCRIALDDFGSGLSSFGYLKSLPVDFIKIDGAFVRDSVDDPLDWAMIEAIDRMGHAMGIKTIAESVETERILEQLRTIGVDYAQGYAIAMPRPFEEYLRPLQN
jgi:diguanylate cyclase (GGDEF)-like protein/PAS domain S-box-containing protein